MARRTRPTRHFTGLYHARQARGMSRSELVRLSGISKQQLSRLENGQIRLRLDHLKPFAGHLGYTPEQILLWGRFPGTGDYNVEPTDAPHERPTQKEPSTSGAEQMPELEIRAGRSGKAMPGHELRKDGRHADPLKTERWLFPASFVREQLHTSPERLVVLDTTGESMAPTIVSGERVIVDTGHKTPTPDGLYAIRDTFECIVVKRLQVLRSSRPTRVKVISDNPNHPSEEAPLGDLEIVGKVLCCLKLF
jgi:transcriptional regulator with XRE-family HTH domain